MNRCVAGLSVALLAASVYNGLASTASPGNPPTLPGGSKPLACDLGGYKPQQGLSAAVQQDSLVVNWLGEQGTELRMRLGIDDGQPLVRELAVHRSGGQWATLGRNLTPEFEVVSGKRRANNEWGQLRRLKKDTPEEMEGMKWNAFWDAPLEVPGIVQNEGRGAGGPDEGRGGGRGVPPGMPRLDSEIRKARATYRADGCQVVTNGARLEVTFPGVSMGIFSGRLVYTVYRGTNLVRQEAVAKTDEPSVAYKYQAGLSGFETNLVKNLAWQDTSRGSQRYTFGGSVNSEPVAVKARNRLLIAETAGGSIAVFPPPHKFFWAREIATNLGYVYYRKQSETSLAMGIRQADREEWPYNPVIYALYNAPAGTWQHMPVYFYLSPGDGRVAQRAALAFTHDDTFKPLAGYQVAGTHFHIHLHKRLLDYGMDYLPPSIAAFRQLGLNIVSLHDFHPDPQGARLADNQGEYDPGPRRFKEQQALFEGARRLSDRNFLVWPTEETDVYLGGHTETFLPRPVYFSKVRQAGQPMVEQQAPYGELYHLGSLTDLTEMVKKFGGLIGLAHPETKGSAGYLDQILQSPIFPTDLFFGTAYQSLPVDLSEQRLCERRCFDVLDLMNNKAPGPKLLLAENDTYETSPEEDLYAYTNVNYIKLAETPRFDDDWSPILRTVRRGDFFVTSGEVLFRSWDIEGTGARRTLNAEVEWTFPLEFAELVWGDGEKVERQIIPATDRQAFGAYRFKVPFDATGKKWVRFAVWDSAGNGAFLQPVHLR